LVAGPVRPGQRLGQSGLMRTGLGLRARPKRKGIRFAFFEIFFSAKTNSRKPQKMFRGTKNTQKIPKISGKFPKVH
jgi:hypothetical protein